MCGLAGVAIVPLVKSDTYQDVLRFLVALAVGTLVGDALMVNRAINIIHWSYKIITSINL